MREPHLFRRAWWAVCLALSCVLHLNGCGGTSVAGVGSGGSGVAEGSVTGFGSVIVDGVAYGDSAAAVTRWGESGVAEAKLGQRVRLSHDASGQANSIVVLPQFIGQASGAPNGQGDFVLLGQRVRIVGSTNADYPATVFEGLTQVAAGDALEVHGSWSRDGGGQLLIASRIERLASTPDPVLLTAVVLTRQGNRLTLDDAANTPVRADDLPDTVQAGDLLSLWLPRDQVQTPSTLSNPWVASRSRQASASTDGGTLKLNAVVGSSDSQQGFIRVQGLTAKLPAAYRDRMPSVGTPVQLTLEHDGTDWQVKSLSTQAANSAPTVEIKGSLRWNSRASSLQLRGTSVQLSSNVLTGSCAGLQDGQEVYVSLKAVRRSPGLPPQATEMTCSRQIPQASVQEAQGTLLSVDAAQNTLSVSVGDNTLVLIWANGQTLMPAPSQLRTGMSVEIEYQRSSNGLMLRKLKPE